MTCLARGDAGDPPAGAWFVRADRDRHDAYDGIEGEDWDAVIDVARQPAHVRRAATALLLPLTSDVMESIEPYGEAKVACEQAVAAAFGPERTLTARADLIGGPGDGSGRSGYRPWRFARTSTPDGTVLVPETPNLPTALHTEPLVSASTEWLLSTVFRTGAV